MNLKIIKSILIALGSLAFSGIVLLSFFHVQRNDFWRFILGAEILVGSFIIISLLLMVKYFKTKKESSIIQLGYSGLIGLSLTITIILFHFVSYLQSMVQYLYMNDKNLTLNEISYSILQHQYYIYFEAFSTFYFFSILIAVFGLIIQNRKK